MTTVCPLFDLTFLVNNFYEILYLINIDRENGELRQNVRTSLES